jgi:hypothetical protein
LATYRGAPFAYDSGSLDVVRGSRRDAHRPSSMVAVAWLANLGFVATGSGSNHNKIGADDDT